MLWKIVMVIQQFYNSSFGILWSIIRYSMFSLFHYKPRGYLLSWTGFYTKEITVFFSFFVPVFQSNHQNCSLDLRCRTQQDYTPTKRVIKSMNAATALLNAVKATNIYKYAEDFAKVLNNFFTWLITSNHFIWQL